MYDSSRRVYYKRFRRVSPISSWVADREYGRRVIHLRGSHPLSSRSQTTPRAQQKSYRAKRSPQSPQHAPSPPAASPALCGSPPHSDQSKTRAPPPHARCAGRSLKYGVDGSGSQARNLVKTLFKNSYLKSGPYNASHVIQSGPKVLFFSKVPRCRPNY